MPKLTVSIDGVVIREAQLTKDRTSLGRRPYNDIVIDNLAVSGEHAVLQMSGNEVYLEDLNSTNGTYVNGKAVKKQLLQNNDTIEIGKYKIRYLTEADQGGIGTATAARGNAGLAATLAAEAETGLYAGIKVLTGAAAGREVALVKVVTTIGKPGVAVAVITKRPQGYMLAHVEGSILPTLNGAAVDTEAVMLKNGDVLELAGTQMQFV
ncbi:MAG: FHA domain-containing protein, partial [Polaromonas sp.]|nr:FHA domain-containing protein [Polaromonas sp.]